MRSACTSAVVFPVSRAISPGCGVRMRVCEGRLVRPRTPAHQRVGVQHHRLRTPRPAPCTSAAICGACPSPGPIATTVLPCASASRSAFSAMLPDSVSGSGSVINSGACDRDLRDRASRPKPPSPAPRRRAARRARTSPPRRSCRASPPPPARARTCPCAPPGARRQQLAEHRRLHAARATTSAYSVAGLPIAPHHQFAHVVAIRRHHLRHLRRGERHRVIGAREFADRLARIARHARRNDPPPRPWPAENRWLISRMASSIAPVAGPLMPVPSSASITSVAMRASAGISRATGQPHATQHRVDWPPHRPSTRRAPPAAPRAASAGGKRVKSCRAITRPSPPLLPLPHSTTMRCVRQRRESLRQKLHHAMPGILHQDDARDAELDRAPVHLAHFGRGQNSSYAPRHHHRHIVLQFAAPVHCTTASIVRAIISDESAFAYFISRSFRRSSPNISP